MFSCRGVPKTSDDVTYREVGWGGSSKNVTPTIPTLRRFDF